MTFIFWLTQVWRTSELTEKGSLLSPSWMKATSSLVFQTLSDSGNGRIYSICLSRQCSLMTVVVWMRTAPIGSQFWTLGLKLMEVFGKDWEVGPCWRRCVARGSKPLLVSPSPAHTLWKRCKLLLLCHACLQAAMLPAVKVTDSGPLKL